MKIKKALEFFYFQKIFKLFELNLFVSVFKRVERWVFIKFVFGFQIIRDFRNFSGDFGKFKVSRNSANHENNKRICVLIIIKCFKPYSVKFAINWIFHTKSPLKFRNSRIIFKPKTNLMKTQRSTLLNTKSNKSTL
jgi:hypothetical protein